MSHPVQFHVEHPSEPRDRVSALLRPILNIPHALLVGGPFVGVGAGGWRPGAFGAVAGTIAVIDWFAILFTGRPVAGLQQLKRLYLRWRARMLAYATFLRDEYPPFGEGPYPAELELPEEPLVRDRMAVAARILFLIPHLVVLVFLLIASVVATVASWVMLVFTGRLPESLWRLNRDVMSYLLRVEAYALLVHDVFPPIAFSDEPAAAPRSATVTG
jgi:hypothetical protein